MEPPPAPGTPAVLCTEVDCSSRAGESPRQRAAAASRRRRPCPRRERRVDGRIADAVRAVGERRVPDLRYHLEQRALE
jgi:hypothetical protein